MTSNVSCNLSKYFEENEFYSSPENSSENLQEMFDFVSQFLDSYFEKSTNNESQLALFKELKLFLNLLLTNKPISSTDIKIESYLNILDTLSCNVDDFDHGLIFLRFLELSPYIICKPQWKMAFKTILEDKLSEALESNTIRGNPLYVFEMLSVYIRLTKLKIVSQPSEKFKQTLSSNFKSTFAVILKELASDSTTPSQYPNTHFSRSKVVGSISQILKRTEKYLDPKSPFDSPKQSKNSNLQDQIKNIQELIGQVDSLDRENLSKDFQNLISVLKSKK